MLKIVKDTNPSLRLPCKEIPMPITEEDGKLLDEMLQFLLLSQDENYRKKHPECREGVGLAAPQIGVNKRMLVISYDNYDKAGNAVRVEYQLANPKITVNSIRKCYLSGGEGCLSVDEPHPGRVYRHFKIVVEAYDHKLRQNVTITARGYDAVVLQHEIDHLNGILFYDHIDPTNPQKEIPGSIEI